MNDFPSSICALCFRDYIIAHQILIVNTFLSKNNNIFLFFDYLLFLNKKAGIYMNNFTVKPIAHIENDFIEKFGIPRQSGLADGIISKIVFEEEYRVREAFRGLEEYSHLWLLWIFSQAIREKWSPTVRPPRLGGNTRMGVFATRSPFRPNSIGMSSVRLIKADINSPQGPALYVSGADLLNGTPIIDIKPYLAYTDSHPEASDGFALSSREAVVKVNFPDHLLKLIPAEKRPGLISVLEQDPRPQYKNDPEHIYTMHFGNFDIGFNYSKNELNVINIKTFT